MITIPPVDLSALHAAIKAGMLAAFTTPAVSVDYAYNRPGATLPVPCILVDLEAIEPDKEQNFGTEQLGVVLRCSAECITSYKIESPTVSGKLNARLLAASVAALVERNKWGLGTVTPGKFKGSHPDGFHSDDRNYESWVVNWTHLAALGSDLWNVTGATITEGFASKAPRVGPGYLLEYDNLNLPAES